MPTRRKQAAAANGVPTDEEGHGDQAQPVKAIAYPAKTITSSTVNTLNENGTESIGSRLRKRRRTDSSPADESSSASKRAHPRKSAASSRTHGQFDAPPPAELSTSSTMPHVLRHRFSPSESGLIQDGILANQAEQSYISENDKSEIAHNAELQSNSAPDGLNNTGFDASMVTQTIDNQYDSQLYNLSEAIDTESFHHLGPLIHLKIQSLPILDNLATQILNTLAKSTYREILTIATEPDSDPGHAYATLKSLFDHTKKVYSPHEPFLSPYELGFADTPHLNTINKANMATFVSSVFGSQDVGFYHLNENFLDTFNADGSRLLKNQAQMFLDLKTQAYISAVTSGDRSRKEILEDLFPQDLDERLLKRRTGSKQLTPSEMDFVQRARNRRKALLDEPDTDQAVKTLPQKYIWEDFLRDISTYVAKNFEAISGISARKSPRPARTSGYLTLDQKLQLQGQQAYGQHHPKQAEASQQTPQISQTQQETQMQSTNQPPSSDSIDFIGATADFAQKAARAVDFAMQDFGNIEGVSLPQEPPQHGQPKVAAHSSNTPRKPKPQVNREIKYHFENELHPNVPAPPPPHYFQEIQFQTTEPLQRPWDGQVGTDQLHQSYSNQNLIPNPAQSAPTQVLYERARRAATTKSSPSNRRSGTPSQRRPWTSDEENSLMAGLDRVKGPHWSQILAMFGPGGTINEVLKDRNQVQLKDKARNLKLFFLKSGIEVPYYLQFVTGELKTRAPGQAAKNEAKEKGTSDEDRAHYEGVLALAAGSMQDTDQLMIEIEGQSETSQNGVVPTANMGSGVIPSSHNGINGAIDPKIKMGNDNGAEMGTENTDALTDGIEETMMLASQGKLQQQQLPHEHAGSHQLNGASRRSTHNIPRQSQTAPQGIMSVASSNVDPALSN